MSVTAIEIDTVAATVSPLNDHKLALAFRGQVSGEDSDEQWKLLANVFEIHLRPSNPGEPFGPIFVGDGRRTMVPSDLSDEQFSFLRHLLEGVGTPAVRCRLGDVLWTARRDGRAGREAVPSYIATGLAIEDADMWPPCMRCYERAIRLARSLGRNNPLLTDALQHLADRVEHYQAEDSSFFTSQALALLEEFRFGDAAALSSYALTGAKRRNGAGDPHSARPYWDMAAKLLARAGLSDEATQARIESAQTWVTEADQKEAAGNFGAAQSHLESAIQAYRAIPGCKDLLPQLHRRLNAAGAEALKSMRPIMSSPIDIGPLVQAAQRSVQGLSMSEAIYTLACVAPSMDPDELRSQVTEAAKEAPLLSMINTSMYDRTGRIVHKSPGLFTDDPDEREQAFEAQVSRHADLTRHLTVSAQITPALMALLEEHNVEEPDLMLLLEGSALIPDGRDSLFAIGLAAGFRRDMVTAMHLLIPQLEHALRTLLRDAGIITASIDQDGIQSDWPLGRLLSPDVVRSVLPDTLIFELRSLLIFKGSSNIRNKLCHGLLNPDEFGSANVIYTWWLLLNISLHGTPGFQAWMDERVRNNSLEEQRKT